jgi:uncharacterized protein
MDGSIPAAGFLFGVVLGLTGMGGGSLMAPFLILVLGVQPVVAVGTDLVYSSLTKTVGAWIYWRNGLVDLRVVRRLAAGSLPAGLAAAILMSHLRTHGGDAVVRSAIGVVLMLVATVLLARFAFPNWFATHWTVSARHRAPVTMVCGAVVGAAVGLTSVGSGALIAAFLLAAYPLAPAEVVGTDLVHAVLLVTVTAIPAIVTGGVDWPLVIALTMGSVPGVAVGSCLAPRMSPVVLRVALATVLIASGIKLL